ncbi:MAG: hypothetical protein KF850_28670 [Labilithrix sp.]|nr:hypothetical protein [Labilithrix sp.]
MSVTSFAIGFVAGWAVRSTVESSRELAVDVAAGTHGIFHKLVRAVIAEREFLEDLWSEAKVRVGADQPPPEPLHANDVDGPRSREEGPRTEAEAPS